MPFGEWNVVNCENDNPVSGLQMLKLSDDKCAKKRVSHVWIKLSDDQDTRLRMLVRVRVVDLVPWQLASTALGRETVMRYAVTWFMRMPKLAREKEESKMENRQVDSERSKGQPDVSWVSVKVAYELEHQDVRSEVS